MEMIGSHPSLMTLRRGVSLLSLTPSCDLMSNYRTTTDSISSQLCLVHAFLVFHLSGAASNELGEFIGSYCWDMSPSWRKCSVPLLFPLLFLFLMELLLVVSQAPLWWRISVEN